MIDLVERLGLCGRFAFVSCLAVLGTAQSASANNLYSPGASTASNIEILTPSPLLAVDGALVPEKVSLQAMSPVAPGLPVLPAFDVVAECADADLAAERRAAAMRALVEQPTLEALNDFWEAKQAFPADIAAGGPVPPLFLKRLPADLYDRMVVSEKKRAFITLMLPHVLKVNEEIAAERTRLLAIRDEMVETGAASDANAEWLSEMFQAYEVDDGDVDRLLTRIDIIPPALAIAQAAKESGWGKSRFAKNGNALYGQWTWNPEHKGMVPRERPKGKTYRVRAFDDLLDATRAYARNLNTTAAYKRFRQLRARLRAKGESPTGVELTETLLKYSAIGDRYVSALKILIRKNRLTKLNRATLASGVGADRLIASTN